MRPLVVLSIWGTASLAWAVPDLLVHQQSIDETKAGAGVNQLLAPYVAQALEDDGRVRPVVWSMTDPVFREWADTDASLGEIREPDERTVLRTAARKKIGHVMVLSAVREGALLRPRAKLFKNGRIVWRFEPKSGPSDPTAVSAPLNQADMEKLLAEANRSLADGGTIAVTVNGQTDWDATARTVAVTWTRQLAEGPLKELPARSKTRDAVPEQQPQGADIQPAAPDWESRVESLVSEGKLQSALALLRDQVDSDPSDPKARMALAELYRQNGQPMESARSAELAARFAKDPQSWAYAAQRWLEAGDPERARAALGTAVGLGADPGPLRPIQVTLALLAGDVDEAQSQLRGMPPEASALHRALVAALTEPPALSDIDLAQLSSKPVSANDYGLLVLCLERIQIDLVPKVRDLIPRARLQPNSAALLAEAEAAAQRANALSRLVGAVVPPELHRESHESRKLAQIVLAQTAMVVQAFVKSNDADQAEEAALSLSEAIRLAQAVREAFAVESRRR